VLEKRDLDRREEALWSLVESSCCNDVGRRQRIADAATTVLSPDEIYLATMVIALFQFYNAFVDMNGVEPLSPEGYDASGVRLSTQGYAPPETPNAETAERRD
jgi:hypothetical protein